MDNSGRPNGALGDFGDLQRALFVTVSGRELGRRSDRSNSSITINLVRWHLFQNML